MKKFKLFIALITVMSMVLLAVPALAADEGTAVTGTSISFTYDEATATLTFSGKGKMPNYTDTASAANNVGTRLWVDYAGKARNLVIGEGITHIGEFCFYNFSALRNVTLPDSLTVIYKSAFRQIGGTSEVTVNIPSKVNVVGQYAFYSNKLKLIFAERTAAIGTLNASVFYNNATKVEVTLMYEGSNPEVIDNVRNANAKSKTVVLYNPTTNTLTVGKNGELTGFNVGEHTNRAWEKYANKCEKLVIADGTTGMGKRCFKDFTNLSTVVLPEGITRVNSYAFENTNVSVWNLPASLVTPPDGNAVKGFVISSKAYIVYPGTDDISGCFDIAENADVNIYTLENSAFYKEDENYHILTPGINNLGGEYAAVYNTGDAAVEGNIIDAQYTADKASLVTASVKPISVPAGVVRYTGLDAKNANTVVRGIFCFDNDMITPIYNNVSFN